MQHVIWRTVAVHELTADESVLFVAFVAIYAEKLVEGTVNNVIWLELQYLEASRGVRVKAKGRSVYPCAYCVCTELRGKMCLRVVECCHI